MTNDRIARLLEKYAAQTLSPEERKELMEILASQENEKSVQQLIDNLWENKTLPASASAEQSEIMYSQIRQKINPVRVRQVSRLWKAAAAAIFVLIAGTVLWKTNSHQPQHLLSKSGASVSEQIVPGSDKAILQLADGSSIVLEKNSKGIIAIQGSTHIKALENGHLSYEGSSGSSSAEDPLLYNKIITPRGGQYQVQLPDGSMVWLNAASSLRFPARFTKEERIVELNGEAYFEVRTAMLSDGKTKQPFRVKVNDITVNVLGTHFDIMAYNDEAEKHVTLLEGLVAINDKEGIHPLHPAQQAIIKQNEPILVKDLSDPDSYVAWKNGIISFNNEMIPTIMRQIARWYDVEVQYVGEQPAGHYVGGIRRQSDIKSVLDMLELAGGVHFEIEGKTIKVRKV